MIIVDAVDLKKNLFALLAKVENGETITITQNGKNIAVMVPAQTGNWRDKIRSKPKLLVPAEEAFAPMADEWEGYL